jgi:hypothetical protein
MIAHVVLFEPRPDLSDADRASLLDGLRAAADAIPAIRRLQVGRRVLHGLGGYEQAMRDAYSFAAIVEFDDVEGLRSYLAHPAHERIGRHFTESALRALAFDYDVVDVRGARAGDS